MNHKEFHNSISEYIDKKLTGKALSDFEAHLKTCKDCPLELELTRKAVNELKNTKAKELELPQNFYAKLDQKLNAADKKKASFVFNPYFRAFATGFGVILIAFFIRQITNTPEYKSAAGVKDAAKFEAETQVKEKAMDNKLAELNEEIGLSKGSGKAEAVFDIAKAKKDTGAAVSGAKRAMPASAPKAQAQPAAPAEPAGVNIEYKAKKSLGLMEPQAESVELKANYEYDKTEDSALNFYKGVSTEQAAPGFESQAAFDSWGATKTAGVSIKAAITKVQAVEIAEKAWIKAGFDKATLDSFKPYAVLLKDNVWKIDGKPVEGWAGSVPGIEIDAATGAVLKMSQGK